MSAIDDKYQALGGAASPLGKPRKEERATPDGGRLRHYQFGTIYWHPDIGAFEVHGVIHDKYESHLFSHAGVLGYPVSDEQDTDIDDGGRVNHFQHGSIYWHPDTGAFEVHGAIREKWQALKARGVWLGYPTTDESPTRDNVGRFNRFQGGVIHWHPEIGAFEVHGDIRVKYEQLGWEQSPLGYPTSDEQDTDARDGGRVNHFQHGSIYWHPSTGAFEVHGAIREKWQALKARGVWLGYPTTDESPTRDNVGRFNRFQGGVIHWHPEIGAFEVHGDIRVKYEQLGWEQSPLGYPTSDELDWRESPGGGGRRQEFQYGQIVWTPKLGAAVDPLVLHRDIKAGGIKSFGGWVETHLHLDGRVRLRGRVHNSGFEAYDFRIRTMAISGDNPAIPGLDSVAVAGSWKGHVGGTSSLGGDKRTEHWNEESHSDVLAARFWDFQRGRFSVVFDTEGSLTGPIDDIAEVVLKWVGGSLLITPGVGLVIFAGAELGSLIATGSLVPGARILEGTLWLAGPAGTLYAVASEAIASIGSRERELTQTEYELAKRVFADGLPPRDDMRITDTIGPGDRAFVWMSPTARSPSTWATATTTRSPGSSRPASTAKCSSTSSCTPGKSTTAPTCRSPSAGYSLGSAKRAAMTRKVLTRKAVGPIQRRAAGEHRLRLVRHLLQPGRPRRQPRARQPQRHRRRRLPLHQQPHSHLGRTVPEENSDESDHRPRSRG